ncbi:hypothetical protein AC739_15680 [Planococcus glaciei]|uniref:UPF0158 family protein n=1 Tax=Planococcus glaciei TaxID=459472 RepID=UPI00069D3FBA|nr:UPF0158 family protein [Planococcus glaciei]KOF09278.1 hypothetical protein AC739_15680 [Planococcus glaciei]
MKLADKLAEEFLYYTDEMQAVLDRVTGEILYDVDETLIGEPGIDWDDEAAQNLVLIPQISSAEAFEVMQQFTKKQKRPDQDVLKEVLEGKKPFRHFKDQVLVLGLEESWHRFEQKYAKKRMTEWLEANEIHFE